MTPGKTAFGELSVEVRTMREATDRKGELGIRGSQEFTGGRDSG